MAKPGVASSGPDREWDNDGNLILTGSANAYVAATSRKIRGYYEGLRICGRANFTNSGPATITVDEAGPVAIRKPGNGALVGGEIVNGGYYDFVYDAANAVMQATSTPGNGSVTNAQLANMAAQRIKARVSPGSGPPEDATLSEVLDFIGSAAQGDILYRGASVWARLGAGTSGQVLTTLGSGQNPLWRMPYIRSTLAPTTATNVATLDLTIPTDCDILEVELLNILPATDNVNLHCRFSQSGSFLAGAADYNWAMLRVRDASVTGTGDDSDGQMGIANGLDNAAGSRFTVRIFRPLASGVRKTMFSTGTCMNNSSLVQVLNSVGRLDANLNAIDGVRFLFSGGNIASCDYTVNAIKTL